MSKKKGNRTERELMNMFFDTGTHICLRAAGSGSTPLPCPDLLVGGKGSVLAIECKAGKNRPTPLQEKNLRDIDSAGGFALVVNETNMNSIVDIIIGYIGHQY